MYRPFDDIHTYPGVVGLSAWVPRISVAVGFVAGCVRDSEGCPAPCLHSGPGPRRPGETCVRKQQWRICHVRTRSVVSQITKGHIWVQCIYLHKLRQPSASMSYLLPFELLGGNILGLQWRLCCYWSDKFKTCLPHLPSRYCSVRRRAVFKSLKIDRAMMHHIKHRPVS